MISEKELENFFKKNYFEYLLQFLNEDKHYKLIKNKISLTQENTENLKELKYQLAEYVPVKIFEMGFFE